MGGGAVGHEAGQHCEHDPIRGDLHARGQAGAAAVAGRQRLRVGRAARRAVGVATAGLEQNKRKENNIRTICSNKKHLSYLNNV